MRSNSKLILAALMGVLVLSAIGSASASAAFNREFAVEGGGLPQSVTGAGVGSATLNVAEWPKIECRQASERGTLSTGGKSQDTVSYSECSMAGEACSAGSIRIARQGRLIEGGGALEDEFTPASGEVLTELVVGSKTGPTCTVAGIYKVKGSQKCELPEISAFKETHTEDCLRSGSSLTVGEKTARLESAVSISTAKGIRYRAD